MDWTADDNVRIVQTGVDAWRCTNELRWDYNPGGRDVGEMEFDLEQKWVDDIGNVEWRPVPYHRK
jgi:hypothetical protein